MDERIPVTLASDADLSQATYDMGVDSYGAYFAAVCGPDAIVSSITTDEARELAIRLMDFAARVDVQRAALGQGNRH